MLGLVLGLVQGLVQRRLLKGLVQRAGSAEPGVNKTHSQIIDNGQITPT